MDTLSLTKARIYNGLKKKKKKSLNHTWETEIRN